MQSSSGKVKLFFEPATGRVNYYAISISPKGEPYNLIAQKTILQQPFSAIIDEEMIIPGNEYVATFTSYNNDLEESKIEVNFIMEAPDTPRLVSSKSGGNWIEAVWNTDKDVDHFQVKAIKTKTNEIIFEDLNFNNNIKRITGLDMNSEYQFKIYSVVKNIASVPLIKNLLTRKSQEITGGLAANQLISSSNSQQTTAPRSISQYVGPSALDIYQSGSGDSGHFCINTSDDFNFKVMDIYFLVKDLSESQFLDWEKTKSWLIELIEKLPIGQKHIRIALAAYSNDLRVEFEFDKYDNADDMIQHIFNMETRFKSPRNGRFNRAISKTIQWIYNKGQYRENAEAYMYVVTNSNSDDVFTNVGAMLLG